MSPSKADPYGQITCVGPLPPARRPNLIPFSSDNSHQSGPSTLQQLCAKPQYGGNPHGHLAGYCDDRVSAHGLRGNFEDYDRRGVEPVVFDPSPNAGIIRPFDHLRLNAYCLQHCHCTYAQNDSRPDRKIYAEPPSSLPHRTVFKPTTQVNPDVDISLQRYQSLDLRSDYRLPAVAIPFRRQYKRGLRDEQYDWHPVVLAASNRIVCEGTLPTLDLPGPWRTEDFHDLQKLCSNVLDGGLHYANAGAYCDTRTWTVSTTTELIPSLYFIAERDLLGHPNIYRDREKALAVREYCFARCKCTMNGTPTTTQATTSGQMAIKTKTVMFTGKLAQIVIVQTEDGTPITRTFQLSKQETGACSLPGDSNKYDGSQKKCYETLPEKYLPQGPVAKATPSRSLDIVTGSSRHQCGKQCSSYADCHGQNQPVECRCVANPGPLLVKQVGVDPVSTFALCLFMGVLMRKSGVIKLGGRSLHQEEIRESHRWGMSSFACPCNRTYVSTACCDSQSGVLWEHPSLQVGSSH